MERVTTEVVAAVDYDWCGCCGYVVNGNCNEGSGLDLVEEGGEH